MGLEMNAAGHLAPEESRREVDRRSVCAIVIVMLAAVGLVVLLSTVKMDDRSPVANECRMGTDACHAKATCRDTVDSFTCTCNNGWTGDGAVCSDLDECSQGVDSCHTEAACSNNPGSFTCACNSGWTGDGVACSDLDECSQDVDNCHAGATCTNSPGSFSCACNNGWTGDGVLCSDVNECFAGLDDCAPNALCANTAGSFTCTCPLGFSGNGTVCRLNCSGILSESTCGSVNGCTWRAEASVHCQDYCYGLGYDTCQAQTNLCAWGKGYDFCFFYKCHFITSEEDCNAEPFCHYYNGSCASDCHAVGIFPTQCEPVYGCGVTFTTMTCFSRCFLLDAEAQICNDRQGCRHDGTRCKTDCSEFDETTIDRCNGVEGCSWSGTACVPACSENLFNSRECTSITGCEWTESPWHRTCVSA